MSHPPTSTPQNTPDREKLSLKTKLAYGAGDMGAGIASTLESFAFLIFLTDVAGLSAGLAGTILLVGRIWDGVNDPVVGFLSDTYGGLRQHTRLPWGRRHSWMVLGSIPFGLTFFLLWLVPQFRDNPAANEVWLFGYYTLMFILFDTAYTAVNLPYTALTPELTQDYDERTNLTSFRFAFSIGGSILALSLGAGISALFPEPGQLQYMVLGGICAVLSVLPIYWCVWGTEERYEKSDSDSLPLLEQLKIAFNNRPFLFVISIYLFSWLAFQLTAAIIPYYVTNWMGIDQFFTVALVVQGVAIVMLFVWSKLSDRIGKKAVYFIGMSVWILAQIGLFFLSREQVWLLYLLSAVAGCGVAIAYLIPWSMLPDVVDLDELRTGQRREGIFYAFMVLLQKVGLGLGLFIVGRVLEFAGYVERVPGEPIPEQPDSALFAIRLIVGPLPALVLIAGSILTYFYPITREVHSEILLKLRERQSNS
jgi:GPH family glycoside/pentoside/hexuronide:cation symporter